MIPTEKTNKIIDIIIYVFIAIIFIISFHECQKQTCESDYITIKKSDLQETIQYNVEKAFAIGEIRAINGDLRVKRIDNNTYIWVKSPWKNRKPINDTIHIKIMLKFK